MTPARAKWRPTLIMVTAGMIAVVLAVAVAGFAAVRFNTSAAPEVELATALGFASLAAIAVGYVFVRAISRPLSELSDRARRIIAGDPAAIGPLERHGTRELAALSESFMNMAASLSQRSAYVRSYSRHVSHEFKTPITAIRGAAELMLDNEAMPGEQRQRFLRNILSDIARMNELLERLNQHALAETAAPGGAARLGEVVAALQAKFEALQIDLDDDAAELALAIAPQSLLVVLHHLAANAQQHDATRLRVSLAALGQDARLLVRDNGAGISPGNRERVFDPFFTTRRSAGGTGMGLTIARSMLEAHKGAIRLVSGEGGACFELRAPMVRAGLHEIS